MRRWAPLILGAFAAVNMGSGAAAADPENTLLLELKYGTVVIEMRPDLAPNHVARIKELTRQGYYNGAPFHRVIEGFMAQTGDSTRRDGTGGSGQKIKAEFSPPDKAKHVRGVVSMARAQSPDSADSQFFIVFAPANFLDGKYTIWGQVVEGMQFVDMVKKGDPNRNGSVDNPDEIVSMKVMADVQKGAAK